MSACKALNHHRKQSSRLNAILRWSGNRLQLHCIQSWANETIVFKSDSLFSTHSCCTVWERQSSSPHPHLHPCTAHGCLQWLVTGGQLRVWRAGSPASITAPQLCLLCSLLGHSQPQLPAPPPARQCSLLGKDTPENYCDALPRQMGGRENYSTVGSGDIFVLMRQWFHNKDSNREHVNNCVCVHRPLQWKAKM